MDNVKDKISKLLAMATHERSNEHEAEVAMRMAESLMRKHSIDISEVQASTGKAHCYTWRKISIPVGEFAKPQTWMPLWCNYLCLAVAQFTDCKVERTNDVTYGQCVRFMGDDQCAELGYISIEEIIANGGELDLHFTPRKLAGVRAVTS